MGLQSAKEQFVASLEAAAQASTDLEKLAYGAASLSKLAEMRLDSTPADDIYTVGDPAGMNFGIGAVPDELVPAGFIKLSGHDDRTHPNFATLMDAEGNLFVNHPPFFYKMLGNAISISHTPQTGYVLPRAFVDSPKGFLHFKFLAANEGGKMVSKRFMDPVSTNSVHNPIGSLIGGAANTYAGFIDACRNFGFMATTIFQWEVFRLIALSRSQSGASSAYCAYLDNAVPLPKGNNDNALGDVNDSAVEFVASGYSNCALTGSGVPFAKTTHNGGEAGVADVNGNMWKIVTGFTYLAKTGAVCASGATAVAMPAHGLAVGDVIYFGTTPTNGATYNTAAYTVASVVDSNNFTVTTGLERAISATDGVYSARYFRILKTSIDPATITSTNLHDESRYDLLDLTGIVGSNLGITYLGNGTNSVLNFSTDANSKEYKLASCCIPRALGTSASGTAAFGNDYLSRYMRHGLMPIVGGNWNGGSGAGVFALTLSGGASNSYNAVGGFASVSL